MMKVPAVLCAALLVAGCAPSINPALKQSTDALIAGASGAHHEAAPASYQPQPWTAGQWIVFKTTSRDTSPAVTRIGVISQGPEGFWIEQDTQDYSQHTITQILYARMPRTPDEAVDVMQKLITKHDNQAQQVTDFSAAGGPGMAFTKNLMRSMMPNFVFPASVDTFPKEDVTVAAGTFAGTAKFPASFSFGPVQRHMNSWFHPAVPINGAVKGVGTDNDTQVELMDYGQTGATSRLAR